MGFSGTPKDMGPPYGKRKRDPYLPIPLPCSNGTLNGMGIVWVPLTIRGSHVLGGPG